MSESWHKYPSKPAGHFCFVLRVFLNSSSKPCESLLYSLPQLPMAATGLCEGTHLPPPHFPAISSARAPRKPAVLKRSGIPQQRLLASRTCAAERFPGSHKLLTEVVVVYKFLFGAAHCSASNFSNAREGLVALSLLHKPLCFRLPWAARSNSSFLWTAVLTNIQSLFYTEKPAQQNHHL